MSEDKTVEERLRDTLKRVSDLESAFPKDEESGHPDYSSHKKYHRDQISAQENFETSRRKIIANITSWAAIGILTVLGSALAQYLMALAKT